MRPLPIACGDGDAEPDAVVADAAAVADGVADGAAIVAVGAQLVAASSSASQAATRRCAPRAPDLTRCVSRPSPVGA